MPRDGGPVTAARAPRRGPGSASPQDDTSSASNSDGGGHTPALVGNGWILDPLDQEAAVQQKREYFRDHMVAFRQRKKQSLASMKTLHAQLELQLEQRLALRRAIMLSGFSLGLNDCREFEPGEEPDPDVSLEELLARRQEIYSNLVDEAEYRRAEAKHLQQQLEEHIKLKMLLHHELGLLPLTDEQSFLQTPGDVEKPPELRGFFTYFVENEAPFYFEPFTRDECDGFVEEEYRRVCELQDAFNRDAVGKRLVECFGWSVQRSLERLTNDDGSDGALVSRVRFTKRMRCADGEAVKTMRNMAQFAYDALGSQEQYSRIQRTKFVSHTLQTFGDQHQVSLRNAPDPMGSTNVRYLHLLSRVEDKYTADDGNRYLRSTVLMLAVDTPRHKLMREMMPRSDVFWITEGIAFISFVQLDDSHFEIDYGNVTKCMSDEQAQYFMIELGAHLIRWEHLVMPPRLLSFF